MRRIGNVVRGFIRTSRLSRAAQSSGGVRDLALSYYAGELITDALFRAADLRRKGLSLSFNYLPADDELTTAPHLVTLLEALGADAEGVELSVKPSSIGLRESPALARETLSGLCAAAEAARALVTLEMQGPEDYQTTLDLYRSVVAQHESLGITIPVNLRRAERDVHALAADGARVRLCVGSYPVPRAQAIVGEHRKSVALVRCLRILMESSAYPIIATHDPRIIGIAQELARRNERDASSYEFQMLLGVRTLEQRRLVDIGLQCRTYVPFGPGWYEYLATRIAARPRTLWSYARAVLDKR